MKKYEKIRVILFKNWKHVFELAYQTKSKSFDGKDIVKWYVIYYKIGFWDGKC